MKKILFLIFLLCVTGCSEVDVKTKPELMPEANPPKIQPMNMKYVEFGTCKIGNEYGYSLTTDNFGNLNNNIIEMRRYILSEKATIEFYKNLSMSTEDQAKVKK